MYYTEKIEARLNDHDASGLLSYEAILQLLEDVSAHHALKVHDRVSGQGISWILVDWRIQILHRPEQFQKVNIKTWVQRTPASGTTYRDFLITDENEKELIKASSRFALVNTETGKLTRISEELLESYEPEDFSVFEEDWSRLPVPREFDRESPIVLRRSDIDYNGHVHNTRYIDFALDSLSDEEYEASDFHQLRISYRSGIPYGSQPVIKHAVTEDGHFFCIYDKGKLRTMIQLI